MIKILEFRKKNKKDGVKNDKMHIPYIEFGDGHSIITIDKKKIVK